MISVLCLFLALSATARSLECECGWQNEGFGQEEAQGETLDWLNGAVWEVYKINEDKIYDLLVDFINKEVNSKLPYPLKSLSMGALELDSTPRIELATHSAHHVKCAGNQKLTQYIVDLDVTIENPGKAASVVVGLPLGISTTVYVGDLHLNSILRLDILLNSALDLPGIETVKVSFINRPDVSFSVDIGHVIGLETFGIDKMIHKKVEEVIQEKIVYPGMVLIDMRNGTHVTTFNNDPRLNPAVFAAEVSVTPVNITATKTSLEAWVHYGVQDTERGVMMGSVKSVKKFQFLLGDLKVQSTRVRLLEQNVIAKDAAWLDVRPRISSELRKSTVRTRHTTIHQDRESTWNATIDVWTQVIPPVQTIRNPFTGVEELVPSLFSLTNCTHDTTEKGVLYFALHGASQLSSLDNDYDSYVVVKHNGVELAETDVVMDNRAPKFDVKYEMLLTDKSPLSKQVFELSVWDWDRWSKDDHFGTARFVPGPNTLINEPIPLFNNKGAQRGLLWISSVFVPMEFL